MLKLVVKFTAFLTIAIVGLIPVTALIVDDVTVVKVLKEVPSGYKYSETIIKRKQQIASTINNYVDDTLFQLELIIFEFSGDIFARLQPTILELMDTFLPDRQPKKVIVYLSIQPKKASNSDLVSKPTKPAQEPLNIKQNSRKLSPHPKHKSDRAKDSKTLKSTLKQKSSDSKNTGKKIRQIKNKAKKKNIRIDSAKKDHKRGLKYYKAKKFKKASEWFKQAAKKGHASAQYNLGVMSYLGQGVPQDYTQAANWFEKAGNQDHASAQYNLGYIYYEGKGVEKDNLQAYMWIDRSANLGDKKAIKARDTMQIILPKDIFNDFN
mgnify:CR=1 FL=1